MSQHEQRRREASQWLKAHDVDPGVYPIDARLRPDADGWTVDVYATNDRGRKYKTSSGQTATQTIHIADDGNPPPPWLVEQA